VSKVNRLRISGNPLCLPAKSEWDISSIGEECIVVNGGTPKTGVDAYWDGNIKWVTPAEMGKRDTPFIAETRRTITEEGLQNSSATLIPPCSVILSSRAPIGHLVINTEGMATNQGCKGIIPKGRISYKYLYYYLLSKVDLLNELGTGTTFKELSGSKLREVPIPVAPMDEQTRIVEVLDEAFEGLAAASANYGKALQYIRRLSESSFGGLAPRTEQSTWLRTTVKEIAAPRKGAIRTGPFGSQLLHSEFVDEGIAVLGIDNVVANEFRWGKSRFITLGKYHNLERYRVYPGDVLISIMGTCGRCAVVPVDIPVAINTKHLCCITLDASKCLPGYLHAYFLHHPVAQEFLAERAKGSIMAGLNMGIIQELPVLLPPLKKQAEFLAALNLLKADILRLESAFRAKVNALEVLRRSLLDQAFSGNL